MNPARTNRSSPAAPAADAASAAVHRPIRSFVRRAGRLTPGQERALHELWPRFGLPDAPTPLPLDAGFGRRAPRMLEIGFGNGDALLGFAVRHPDWDCLGVEVHEPGVGHCLLAIEREHLTNVRLLRHDAMEVLRTQIPPGSLQRLHLYFPDPWHKKRHHKRRLVQPPFVALVAAALAPGGIFHVATDWPHYADHIAAVLSRSEAFQPVDAAIATGDHLPVAERTRTRFEARGERLGHVIREGTWRRVDGGIDAG